MADHSAAELCALEEWQLLDGQTSGPVPDAAVAEAVAAAGYSHEAAERAAEWLYEADYRPPDRDGERAHPAATSGR
ncbi:hypothetical protein ACFQL1_01880 [Halomicroarcula sp. GCM10025709]|uniref:hypothetical protein n=1 Tax=Haloarcula TaxID=2237 RepID=UPI0024C347F7|nr:hypothetical protein [Halomicroarcula sp. YJ-61-S]